MKVLILIGWFFIVQYPLAGEPKIQVVVAVGEFPTKAACERRLQQVIDNEAGDHPGFTTKACFERSGA